jgi:hypothetical protein
MTRKRKSAFRCVIEDRRDAARRQPAPEEANDREVPEAETPLSRFLLRRRTRRPWK